MIEQITANDFVDVKDIKGMFLYTKSNKIFSYLRIYPFNLDLLTTEDRRNLTNRLAAAFDGDRKNFMYCTLPRELDLDGYKIFLKEKRQAAETLGKKRIIDELIKKATDSITDHGRGFFHHRGSKGDRSYVPDQCSIHRADQRCHSPFPICTGSTGENRGLCITGIREQIQSRRTVKDDC